MRKTLLFKFSTINRWVYPKWMPSLMVLSMLMWAVQANAAVPLQAPDVDGGTITGGPFEFCVGDGHEDHVSDVDLSGNTGSNSQWVVTDEYGKILGLPPNPEAVNFDGAGAGVCLLWHLSYEEGLEGLEGGNNVDDLVGTYDFSNEIRVYRNQPDAGELVGGPFYITVDGYPDMVSGISITGTRSGSNSTFVVTSPEGEILGIPPSLEAVEGIDFDAAGPGTCLIWHLRYEDGLEGLEMGLNANNLMGCYDLSNYIEVVRIPAANAGEITGGPFHFCVDGTPDMVSGIATDGTGVGTNSSWVITDDQGKILGLPPTLEAVEGVDFDGAGAGTCLIWYLRYEDGLEGAEMGMNANNLKGNFDLSNPIYVVRSETEGGTLNGGPYHFIVDGTPDMVTGITLTGPRSGSNSTFVITDDQGKILGLPPSLDAVKGVNFDGAGPGTCFIYHLRYEDGLEGLAPDYNLDEITGCYDLSNAVEVVRTAAAEAGEITGGPFHFCVDGTPDMVSGIATDGTGVGTNSSWVITDDQGKILGLPPTLEAVEGVDFDGAGAGTCLIWYLRYEDGLEGAEMGMNANNLKGNFDLSNPIYVVRSETDAGELVGGPFYITVDGYPDMVSGISITGKRSGANSTMIITDTEGNILGIPGSISAVEGVDFDAAGPGTCLIWHLRYEDGLEGLEMGMNTADFVGCYDLSNYVEVVRSEAISGGTVAGDDYTFCVGDDEADHVSSVSVSGNVGPNSQWVVTSPYGDILGLPPTPEAVNFDGAGEGTCLIWHLSYKDGLSGLEVGNTTEDLTGDYDFSDNYVTVYRNQPEAGELVGGPFYVTVDGYPDMVSGISITGTRSGANSTFVVTSPEGEILGIPPSLEAVEGIDFDAAGPGTCLIWHLRYEDGLEGLEMGLNANDLMGCYDLSNYVEVVRTPAISGGYINGDDYTFCVGDDEADHVSDVTVSGNTGSNSQWVVTSPYGEILGLPPSPEAVDFNGAGAGTCLIWHLSYEDGLEGLEGGNNVSDLTGTYDLSDNYVTVYRNQPEAGTLTGGPFYITVDGTPDMVSGIAITGTRSGSNSTFVVTSPEGEILGIPPSLDAVEGIDFDAAGPGTCLIWHLRYEDGLEGLEMGLNANDLYGCYDLSNYIEVVRTEGAMVDGGMVNGDDYSFCVGDDEADHVSDVTVSGNMGSNSQWVVTSPEGLILGLPPTPEAVDFNGAGAGTCLIWHLSYEDGLEGLEGGNYVADLTGTYDLSDNYVTVYRNQPEAGTLTGGPFEFVVDGTPDMVSGISITGTRSGTNSTFVVTSPEGEILGIPPSLEAVEGIDFDAAGPGTCLIWHLRYEDGLEGLEMGLNANDLMGCYDFSNSVEVVRLSNTSGKGTISLYPSPAVNVVNVSSKSFDTENVQMRIYDFAGNDISSKVRRIDSSDLSFDVQSLPSGIYFLSLRNGKGQAVTEKIVKR